VKVHIVKAGAVAVIAAALVAPAGCGDDQGAASAGGSGGAPVTLRIGTDDRSDRPAGEQIRRYATRVADLSGGTIRVEPVWHAAGDGPDWDQRVARMVNAGTLDMGLIPTRTWDTEGVTSLRALNTPFLITSNAHAAKVVQSDLADDLLSGLERAGVVGLALLPEGMRHPFGLKAPLMGPEDYAGTTIRTPTSTTVTRLFDALGARTDDADSDASIHAGRESGYALKPPGTATGNVTFFPKVNSLVINQKAFDRLDDAQRSILVRAAGQTRDEAVARLPDDAEAARRFCAGGGAVVLADDADVTALKASVRPVREALSTDPLTRRIIERIEQLGGQVGGQVDDAAEPEVAACGEPREKATPTAEQTPIDGIYRYEVTDQELRNHGVTDPGDIAENHGVYTYTFDRGTWCWQARAPNPQGNPDDCGTFDLDGNRMTYRLPDGAGELYTWKLVNGSDLKLGIVKVPRPDDVPVIEANFEDPWKRIGDITQR
jgi:TRAP-type C4-dicarboxylate transport system substrate-binding protein